MARHRKNYNIPGHAHELTFSCYKRFRFLQADRTCYWMVDSINEARRDWQFDLWAYVFMPEHLHMIIWPRQPVYDVAKIRKSIKATPAYRAIRYLEQNAPNWLPKVTRIRNEKEERLFWQSGGGYDRNITEPATLMKMIDYLHLNPVRRGLVEKASDWKWSSADFYENGVQGVLEIDAIPPEWLA
ncbi:MAG: hypothetical protein WD648_03655 [Planctomycetaceae bacterium]